MAMLSTRTKESLKTALAITITIAIALYMDWDKAYWAAFAVAFCSLSTIGQSMNKAAMRMLGTLLAIVVAFTLIGLFPQDRWLFVFSLSLWLGFCTYMGSGPRYQYFWIVAGFVSAVVAIDAGPNGADAFAIAILRSQETALGILVYTLVSLFLWPTSSGPPFLAAASKLASAQRQLFDQSLGLLVGESDTERALALLSEEVTARTSLATLLSAAETDDIEIREQRSDWREYQRLTSEIGQALAHARESLAEYQGLDVRKLIPGLENFRTEIDARFAQIEVMLAGQAPDRQPAAMRPHIDRQILKMLSHFQKAAVAVIEERLGMMDRDTRNLFRCVESLKGFSALTESAAGDRRPQNVFVPDLDRLGGALRLMLIVWLAWLAYIYIDGLPGGSMIVVSAAAIGINLAVMPQLKVRQLFKPTLYGVVLGALNYFFVMPKLSSFASMGVVVFGVTFVLCYRFSEPQQVLDRAMGLAMFILIAGIDNQQTYSFLSVATIAMLFPPFFFIIAATEHFPLSLKPEKSFLRLSRRFFRSCEYLAGTIERDPVEPRGALLRLRHRMHSYEVSTLPGKLALWGRFLKPDILPGSSPAKIQALVSSMQQIGRRLSSLIELGAERQSGLLVGSLDEEFRAWRQAVSELFARLSDDPNAAAASDLDERLFAVAQRLEEHIKASLDQTKEEQYSELESRNFYRLLGGYRGVSESLVGFARRADDIEWEPWYEERFA